MIYIACPYTDESSVIQEQRYAESCRAASLLMRAGIAVYNPLAQTVTAIAAGLSLTYEKYLELDTEALSRCSEMIVLLLPGWENSVGVHREMEVAAKLQKRVTLVPEGLIEDLPYVLGGPVATKLKFELLRNDA
jgi:Domain of unknown function (DUF1937).